MPNEDVYCASLYIVPGSTDQLETAVGHEFKTVRNLKLLQYCVQEKQ